MGRSWHEIFILRRRRAESNCTSDLAVHLQQTNKQTQNLIQQCSFHALQNRLDVINLPKAVEFVMSCCNADGGFGSRPNAESHAGLIYCCVGFLSITNHLHLLDTEKLCWWLCERQLPSGGLNGRPEKLPDVCYSWWVLSSLTIMGRLHWISAEKLQQFILSCQDNETGGFSDRTGNLPDIFHTLFGLGALSLLSHDSLKPINPTYCMPQYVIDRLGLKPQLLWMTNEKIFVSFSLGSIYIWFS